MMTGAQLSDLECKVRVGKTGGPCIRVAGHGDVSPYEVVHIDEYGQRSISSEHPTRPGDGTPKAVPEPVGALW
jgi:hypothetical protein